MSYTHANLCPGYLALYHGCVVAPKLLDQANRAAEKIVGWRTKGGFYDDIESATGFPWFWIGPVHFLESSLKLTSHLHNGDPLTGRTVNVPKGRPKQAPADGKRYSFAESARDALSLQAYLVPKGRVWPLCRLMFAWEGYNGFGYRAQQKRYPDKVVRSGYLWAGTNRQGQGRYVKDNVFDIHKNATGAGAMAILLRLCALGHVDEAELLGTGYRAKKP
jgi:lysozyme family protein